eukprot:5468972-Pyramimonas_sp.AAC.1
MDPGCPRQRTVPRFTAYCHQISHYAFVVPGESYDRLRAAAAASGMVAAGLHPRGGMALICHP